MKKLLIDLFTCPDNVTWDLVRLSVGASLAFALGAASVTLYKTGTLDLQQFGVAVAAIIAAGAGGMWARKDVEVLHHEEKAK